MADRAHNPAEEETLADYPLVEILAEMVRSALEWEVDTKFASEREFSANDDATGIDCPTTDS